MARLRLRPSETVLLRLFDAQSSQYICHTCRAQRQLHTSRPLLLNPTRGRSAPAGSDSSSYLQRIRETIFGPPKSSKAIRKVEEKPESSEERSTALLDLDRLEGRVDGKGVPLQFQVAEVIDPRIYPDYVSAVVGDGLERVGGEQWVKAREDGKEQYMGFSPADVKRLSLAQWNGLLHGIVVEAVMMRNGNYHLSDLCSTQRDAEGWSRLLSAPITVDKEEISIGLVSENHSKAILQHIPKTNAKMRHHASRRSRAESFPTPREDLETLVEIPKPASLSAGLSPHVLRVLGGPAGGNQEWMNMQLSDPVLKFAILKRVLQLTGKRLSDPVISRCKTVLDLRDALKTKEAPRKLAETPAMKSLASNLPNVSVYAIKRRMSDKEKEIGRWKLIKEALVNKDLLVSRNRWRGMRTELWSAPR